MRIQITKYRDRYVSPARAAPCVGAGANVGHGNGIASGMLAEELDSGVGTTIEGLTTEVGTGGRPGQHLPDVAGKRGHVKGLRGSKLSSRLTRSSF